MSTIRRSVTTAIASVLLALASISIAQDGHQHDHVHAAVLAGSEILPALGEHGWHHQVVEVTATADGFSPSVFTVRQGEPFIVVFSNPSDVEHHFHIMGLEPVDLSWFMVMENGLDQFDLDALFAVERAKDHICDSVTGICRLGINVHLHANPGSFDAIMFTAPTAGTFVIEDPLHPELLATIIVAER
jgi:uncharacterized cupredoxin-like copper-binding protein